MSGHVGRLETRMAAAKRKTDVKTQGEATTIRFYFKGQEEYRFLSNFYPSPFTVGGLRYESNEHFFQSRKAIDPEQAESVRAAPTALRRSGVGAR